MYKSGNLVPTRFLVLIAHFVILVNLLWNDKASLKSCSMETPIEFDHNSLQHHTGIKTGIIIGVGLICLEFVCFILGFTMFNVTSALLSIFCHALACLTSTLFILDGWPCGWFWWIFTFGSIFPLVYDVPLVIYLLRKRRW